MYEPDSSQKRYWTFPSEQDLVELRVKHNQEFIEKYGNVSLTGNKIFF